MAVSGEGWAIVIWQLYYKSSWRSISSVTTLPATEMAGCLVRHMSCILKRLTSVWHNLSSQLFVDLASSQLIDIKMLRNYASPGRHWINNRTWLLSGHLFVNSKKGGNEKGLLGSSSCHQALVKKEQESGNRLPSLETKLYYSQSRLLKGLQQPTATCPAVQGIVSISKHLITN